MTPTKVTLGGSIAAFGQAPSVFAGQRPSVAEQRRAVLRAAALGVSRLIWPAAALCGREDLSHQAIEECRERGLQILLALPSEGLAPTAGLHRLLRAGVGVAVTADANFATSAEIPPIVEQAPSVVVFMHGLRGTSSPAANLLPLLTQMGRHVEIAEPDATGYGADFFFAREQLGYWLAVESLSQVAASPGVGLSIAGQMAEVFGVGGAWLVDRSLLPPRLPLPAAPGALPLRRSYEGTCCA